MADEDFEIKLRASGADKAADEVGKVEAATTRAANETKGFGGQSEGTDKLVRGLEETLQETERTAQDVAIAIEELDRVTEQLAETQEDATETLKADNEERRQQAQDDVEDLKASREARAAELSDRQRIAAGFLAAGITALNGYGQKLQGIAKDMQVINGEAAETVEAVGLAAADFADFGTKVAAGFALGGPLGGVVGALAGALDLVTGKVSEAKEKVEAAQRGLEGNLSSLQQLIAAERSRDANLARGDIEKAYQNRIVLINDELRALKQLVALERIRSGGQAVREGIAFDAQERSIQRQEGPETRKTTDLELLKLQELALVEARKQEEIERKITEQKAAISAQLDLEEAAREKLADLISAGADLGPNRELAGVVQGAVSPGARNAILNDDAAALQAAKEQASEAVQAAIEGLQSQARLSVGLEDQLALIEAEQAEAVSAGTARIVDAQAQAVEKITAANEAALTSAAEEIFAKGLEQKGPVAERIALDMATLFNLLNDDIANGLQGTQINTATDAIVTQLVAYGVETRSGLDKISSRIDAEISAMKQVTDRLRADLFSASNKGSR